MLEDGLGGRERLKVDCPSSLDFYVIGRVPLLVSYTIVHIIENSLALYS